MIVRIDTTARIERVRLENQASSPASPAAGYSQLYARSDLREWLPLMAAIIAWTIARE